MCDWFYLQSETRESTLLMQGRPYIDRILWITCFYFAELCYFNIIRIIKVSIVVIIAKLTVMQQRFILFGALFNVHETEGCKEGAPDTHKELAGAEKGKRSFDSEASGVLVALRSDGGIVQAWIAQTGSSVHWNNNGE